MHSFWYTKPITVVAVIAWRNCDPSGTQSQNRIVGVWWGFFTSFAPSRWFSLERWLRIEFVRLWGTCGGIQVWLYLHNTWAEVSASGYGQRAHCWGLPRVKVLITQWPGGRCRGERWDFSRPWALHPQPQKSPASVCSIVVGGKRGGDGHTPAPQPNSWWLASRCGGGMWWPLSLHVLPPQRTPEPPSCGKSIVLERGRESTREGGWPPPRNWEALAYRTIARFCMIKQNRNSCGSRK